MPTRHKCKNISNTSPAYDVSFIDDVSRVDLIAKTAIILEKYGEKVAHSEGREARWKSAAEAISIYASGLRTPAAKEKLTKNAVALNQISVKWSHVDSWLHQGFIGPLAPFKDLKDLQAQMKHLEMIRKDLEKGQTTDKLNATKMNSSFQLYKGHVEEGVKKFLKDAEAFRGMCEAWVLAEKDFNANAVSQLTGAGNIPNQLVSTRLAAYNDKPMRKEMKSREKLTKSQRKKREKSEKSFRKSREKSEKSLKKKMEQKEQRSMKGRKSGEKASTSEGSSKSGKKAKKGNNITLGALIQKSMMKGPSAEGGSMKSAKEKSKMTPVKASAEGGSMKSAKEKSKMAPVKGTSVMKPPTD